METTDNLESREAKHGEKMIEVKVRFWTNGIAEGEGMILPGHAWSAGVVRMERNESHGIVPESPVPFHSLMHLPAVIEDVLISHGVVLHPSSKTQKYMKE